MSQFHREEGCPSMAIKGEVYKYDTGAAASIIQQWFTKLPRFNDGCGGHGGCGHDSDGASSTPPPSVSRVTTPPASEIRQQQPPPPLSTPAPTLMSHCYDEIESSDLNDDGAAFDDTFANVASNNNNAATSN
jgi:hypothetical protein